MGKIVVSDDVIWAKHILGNADLIQALNGLPGGEPVALIIDGVEGQWCKMEDGKDGRPTKGLRPVGRTKAFWKALYQNRLGEAVAIDMVPRAAARQPSLFAALARSEPEREAALQALLGLAGQGWRSEGRSVSRDEMHER
jgi:hypothetical protein